MADGFTEFTVENLQTNDGIAQINAVIRKLYDNISGDGESVRVFNGYGSPEGVLTAGIGSLYLRVDGGANTSAYFKESGTGNTGWVARSNITLPLSVANGGTGADNSGALQGVIPYFSATGVISGLATGTSGQFLKTNGASANPSWATFTQYLSQYSVTGTLRVIASIATEVIDTTPSHKTTPMARSGTVRASIDAKAFGGIATGTVYFAINGTQAGSTHNTNSGYQTFTDDLTVALGDVITVVHAGTNNGYVKNFSISASNPLPELAVVA